MPTEYAIIVCRCDCSCSRVFDGVVNFVFAAKDILRIYIFFVASRSIGLHLLE